MGLFKSLCSLFVFSTFFCVLRYSFPNNSYAGFYKKNVFEYYLTYFLFFPYNILTLKTVILEKTKLNY